MRKLLTVIGKILLLLLIALVIMTLLSAAAYAVVWIRHGLSSGENPPEAVLNHIQFIAVIASVFMMRLGFKEKIKWPLGLTDNQGKSARQWVTGMLAGIVLMAVCFVLIWVFGGITVDEWVMDSAALTDFALAVVLFLFVAFNEELLTRGYIQGLVKYNYGTTSAIVVSSLVFAILHGMNPGMWESPIPMANLLLVAVILGLIREVSGSLLIGMGFHFTWNLFQGNIFGFKVSGMGFESFLHISPSGDTLLNGGAFGAEGSIVTTFVLLGFLIFAVIRNKKWMG